MHIPSGKSVEQTVQEIFALDLEPIKFKLMSKQEGQGWSREEVDHYELEYKRFLALLVKYPDEVIAPDTSVDKFWHGHILDTMKYERDCRQIFGAFLHHYPYFGMRGEDDAANLEAAFVRMKQLHGQTFGAAATGQPAWCGVAMPKEEAAAAAWCGAARPPQGEATAAWCGAALPGETEAAWCGAARPVQGEVAAAWCGAALPRNHEAAWCGAARPVQGEAAAAWCGAAFSEPRARSV